MLYGILSSNVGSRQSSGLQSSVVAQSHVFPVTQAAHCQLRSRSPPTKFRSRRGLSANSGAFLQRLSRRRYPENVTYLVSATDEIRHPGSLIARFLRSEFPVLAGLASDFEQQIYGATTLAPSTAGSDYPWSLVGTAIDYRLRFLFEILPVTRLQAFQAAQGWHISDAGTALGEQVMFPNGPNSRRVVSMTRERGTQGALRAERM
jgi:hypothetical protein